MGWEKSSDSMIERFGRLLPADPRVERRTMFGCPMAVANGNLFLGLHENRFLIRLGDDDRAVLIKEYKAKAFEPMPGRKSGATLVLPDRIAADPAALRSWCDKALSHALSLPPKKAKKKAAPVKKTARAKPPRTPRRSVAKKRKA
jgi:TfoX/Sxy family transcriptional regulator of competence genes